MVDDSFVTCPDCGEPMAMIQKSVYRCSNEQCPGGANHYTCGYCGQPSFSEKLKTCTNTECPTHGLTREVCYACKHFSWVTIEGQGLCIYRRCPSNADRVDECTSCGTKSLIKTPIFSICIKSSCPTLLKPRFPNPETPDESDKGKENSDPWGMSRPDPTGSFDKELVNDSAGTAEPARVSEPTSKGGIDFLSLFGGKQEESEAAQETMTGNPNISERPAEFTIGASDVPTDKVWATKGANAEARQPIEEPSPDETSTREEPPQENPAETAEATRPGGRSRSGVDFRSHSHADFVTQPIAYPSPARRDIQPGGMEEAYDFVQRMLLSDDGQFLSPLIIIFGVCGSGKSTYLTMLGEILAHGSGKYHFPYNGVGVRSVRLEELLDDYLGSRIDDQRRQGIRSRVKDLTYEYSSGQFNDFLVNGAWPPPTVRETGAEGPVQSCFLVTEIVHNGATLGRLVTVETSGEDYSDLLKGLDKVRSVDELEKPLHRVLWQLLDSATGIVLLLDPLASENDQTYADFFRILSEGLEGRAAHSLSRLVDEELAKATSLGDPSLLPESVTAVISKEKEDEERLTWERNERARFVEDLKTFQENLAQTGSGHADMAAFVESHREQINELDLLMRHALPDFYERSQEMFDQHGRTVSNYRKFFLGIIDSLKDAEAFTAALKTRLDLHERRQKDTSALIQRITQSKGLKQAPHEAVLKRWEGRSAPKQFARLAHVSMVVTKSDMCPIVYPPSDYPKFKLPTCHQHIESLQSWLQLLGGDLACYNATAIGYAVQRGDGYAPGPGNSFTPVNIVEPIFDMLPEVGGEGEVQ